MRIFYYTKDNKIKELSIRYLLLIVIPIVILFSITYSLSEHLLFNSEEALKAENKRLKNNLNYLNEKFEGIRLSINDLRIKERRLRIASNIKLNNSNDFGTGGYEESNLAGLFNSKDSKINEMSMLADNILNEINFHYTNFNKIEEKLKVDNSFLSCVPSILPMNGVMGERGFGMRLHPVYHVWKMHDGQDILGEVGDPIFASGNGKVIFTGYRGGYGLCVEIDHGYGYTSLYGHLSVANVKEGQMVKRFQKIGECGNTGVSIGPHLHYEITYNGEKVDPMNYIFN